MLDGCALVDPITQNRANLLYRRVKLMQPMK